PIYLSPEPSGPRPGVRFSRQELFQLGVAILALSAALTLANAMALRNSYAASELPLRVGLGFSSALVAVASGVGLHEISHKIFVTIILINAWYLNVILAGFNMIPVMPFDGSKVWAWNKAVYAGILVVALALYLSGVYLGITAI